MNNLILNPAPFNNDENNEYNDYKNIKNNKNKRLPSSNRTIKNRNYNNSNEDSDKNNERNNERNRRIQKLLNEKINMDELTNNESDSLDDFCPPPYPEIQEPKKIITENFMENMEVGEGDAFQGRRDDDISISKENFQQLSSKNLGLMIFQKSTSMFLNFSIVFILFVAIPNLIFLFLRKLDIFL